MDVRIEEEEITGVQSSGTRALKEGHKLVISAKEDGFLFLGLACFEEGIRRSQRETGQVA